MLLLRNAPRDYATTPFERSADSTSLEYRRLMCTDDDPECNCAIKHGWWSCCHCQDEYLICYYKKGIIRCYYNAVDCDRPVNCSFNRASRFRICRKEQANRIVLQPYSEHDEWCEQMICSRIETSIGPAEDSRPTRDYTTPSFVSPADITIETETKAYRPSDYVTFERPAYSTSMGYQRTMCTDDVTECKCTFEFGGLSGCSCNDPYLICKYDYGSVQCNYKGVDCNRPAGYDCSFSLRSRFRICRDDKREHFVLQLYVDDKPCAQMVCSKNETWIMPAEDSTPDYTTRRADITIKTETMTYRPSDYGTSPFERPADDTSLGYQIPMCTDADAECNCPAPAPRFSLCICDDAYLMCYYTTGLYSNVNCLDNLKICDKAGNCSDYRITSDRLESHRLRWRCVPMHVKCSFSSRFRICRKDNDTHTVLQPYGDNDKPCPHMVCFKANYSYTTNIRIETETMAYRPSDNVSVPFERPADNTSVGYPKPMCTDDDRECNCPVQHELSKCSCNDPYLTCDYDNGMVWCQYYGVHCDTPVNCSFNSPSRFRICRTDRTHSTGTQIVLKPYSECDESCEQMMCSREETLIGTTEHRPHDCVTAADETFIEMCPDGSTAACFYVASNRWPFSICHDPSLLCAYGYYSKNNFNCWHRNMDCGGPARCPTLLDNTAYICRTDSYAETVLQPFNDFHEPCDRIVCSTSNGTSAQDTFSDMMHSLGRSMDNGSLEYQRPECPVGVIECDCVLSEMWPVCSCRDTRLICMYEYNSGHQIFQCWHDNMTCEGPAFCLTDPHRHAHICRIDRFKELVLHPFTVLVEHCDTEMIRCWNKTLTTENFAGSTTTLPDDMAYLGTCIALRFSSSGHLPPTFPPFGHFPPVTELANNIKFGPGSGSELVLGT